MKFLLLAVLLLVVVAVVVLRSRRGTDVVHEVDQFSRARQMTTSWSQGGWSGPPRSPAEADLGEPRRTEEPPAAGPGERRPG